MKYITLATALLLVLGVVSCKKDLNLPTDVANIVVVHAMPDVPTLVVNPAGKEGVWKALIDSYTGKVNYGAILGTPIKSGNAGQFKIASATDTTKILYKVDANFAPQPGSLYTLFAIGTAQTPDHILLKENLIQRGDSITGLRFINLGLNLNAIKVNIRNATGAVVDQLNFKEATDFVAYKADYKNPNYVFELREKDSNNLLLSYTYVVARTYNVSLVLRGTKGGIGTNALAITRVNHY